MFDPPGRRAIKGGEPTIVDWMRLAHEAPETQINTADAAAILTVETTCVRRLIEGEVLKPVEEGTPYVLMLVDVLRYRLHRKRRRKGGAS